MDRKDTQSPIWFGYHFCLFGMQIKSIWRPSRSITSCSLGQLCQREAKLRPLQARASNFVSAPVSVSVSQCFGPTAELLLGPPSCRTNGQPEEVIKEAYFPPCLSAFHLRVRACMRARDKLRKVGALSSFRCTFLSQLQLGQHFKLATDCHLQSNGRVPKSQPNEPVQTV